MAPALLVVPTGHQIAGRIDIESRQVLQAASALRRLGDSPPGDRATRERVLGAVFEMPSSGGMDYLSGYAPLLHPGECRMVVLAPAGNVFRQGPTDQLLATEWGSHFSRFATRLLKLLIARADAAGRGEDGWRAGDGRRLDDAP